MLDHDLLSRFTTHLKEALQKALAFSISQGRSVIEPGDLLVGLTQETGCIASEFLTRAGISPEEAAAFFSGTPDRETRGGSIAPDLAKPSRHILEQAVVAARNFEHRYVGTEHLLFALVSHPDELMEQFFEQHKLARDTVREQVLGLLKSTAKFPEVSHNHEEEETPSEEETPAQPDGKRPAKTARKALDTFARHLTDPTTAEKLDPVIGRDAEMERVIEILCRRTKNNPVLLGEPGVGKTALVEGLATRLAKGQVPDVLQGKRLYAIDLALMVAGTMYRGEFEGRLKQLVEEVKNDPHVILFIDEIHTIVGAGSTSGSLDAANILKPALSRGEIRCIGATTWAEYKKHLEPDAALERRFQPVEVPEPTREVTLKMLEGLKPRYEAHHGVTYEAQTLSLAVALAERYLTDRFFPDKAIDILDEAGAHVASRLHSDAIVKRLQAADTALNSARRKKEEALEKNVLKEAAKAAKDEARALKTKATIETELQNVRTKAKLTVKKEDIFAVVSRLSRVPQTTLSSAEEERLKDVETRLGEKVLGQQNAVRAVADVVRRARLGLSDPRRPKGSWLFVGPSGTGKTELARQLAIELFGKEDALVRFDMSEFSEGHSVSKLLGSPAGYVGFREQNRLSDTIRKRPHVVILLDEFEKAHPDVQHLLLQMLEDGVLQDSSGKSVSFRHAYIILTSNAGSDLLKQKSLGFGDGSSASGRADALVHEHLRERFRPELLNRLDRIVIFQPLGQDILRKILDRELRVVFDRLKTERSVTYKIGQTVLDWLLKRAWKPEEGARAARRTIEQEIESLIVTAVLKQPNKKKLTLEIGKAGPEIK
ncbi:ATP-dependent Clp protease ATP-binding subunit [Patescibacteria group bacterium]|nr:ATP-dependent Clp protease ATP-binding subunit [Patescibacteria group bacterium]